MKKNIFLFLIIIFSVIFVAPISLVRAANPLDPACSAYVHTPEDKKPSLCQGSTTEDVGNNSIYGPNGILTKVASILSIIVGIVCVIAIIVAGLRYILSGGDSQQAASAKNAILYAIVGLVVAVSARVILSFVIGRI